MAAKAGSTRARSKREWAATEDSGAAGALAGGSTGGGGPPAKQARTESLALEQTLPSGAVHALQSLQGRLLALRSQHSGLQARMESLNTKPDASLAQRLRREFAVAAERAANAGTPAGDVRLPNVKRSDYLVVVQEQVFKDIGRNGQRMDPVTSHVYKVSGKPTYALEGGRIGIQFDAVYQAREYGTYYVILVSDVQRQLLSVKEHTLPHFLPVQQTAELYLRKSIKMFVDRVRDVINAFISRREQVAQLRAEYGLQMLECYHSLAYLLLEVAVEGGCKVTLRVTYKDEHHFTPNSATVMAWPKDGSSQPGKRLKKVELNFHRSRLLQAFDEVVYAAKSGAGFGPYAPLVTRTPLHLPPLLAPQPPPMHRTATRSSMAGTSSPYPATSPSPYPATSPSPYPTSSYTSGGGYFTSTPATASGSGAAALPYLPGSHWAADTPTSHSDDGMWVAVAAGGSWARPPPLAEGDDGVLRPEMAPGLTPGVAVASGLGLDAGPGLTPGDMTAAGLTPSTGLPAPGLGSWGAVPGVPGLRRGPGTAFKLEPATVQGPAMGVLAAAARPVVADAPQGAVAAVTAPQPSPGQKAPPPCVQGGCPQAASVGESGPLDGDTAIPPPGSSMGAANPAPGLIDAAAPPFGLVDEAAPAPSLIDAALPPPGTKSPTSPSPSPRFMGAKTTQGAILGLTPIKVSPSETPIRATAPAPFSEPSPAPVKAPSLPPLIIPPAPLRSTAFTMAESTAPIVSSSPVHHQRHQRRGIEAGRRLAGEGPSACLSVEVGSNRSAHFMSGGAGQSGKLSPRAAHSTADPWAAAGEQPVRSQQPEILVVGSHQPAALAVSEQPADEAERAQDRYRMLEVEEGELQLREGEEQPGRSIRGHMGAGQLPKVGQQPGGATELQELRGNGPHPAPHWGGQSPREGDGGPGPSPPRAASELFWVHEEPTVAAAKHVQEAQGLTVAYALGRPQWGPGAQRAKGAVGVTGVPVVGEVQEVAQGGWSTQRKADEAMMAPAAQLPNSSGRELQGDHALQGELELQGDRELHGGGVDPHRKQETVTTVAVQDRAPPVPTGAGGEEASQVPELSERRGDPGGQEQAGDATGCPDLQASTVLQAGAGSLGSSARVPSLRQARPHVLTPAYAHKFASAHSHTRNLSPARAQGLPPTHVEPRAQARDEPRSCTTGPSDTGGANSRNGATGPRLPLADLNLPNTDTDPDAAPLDTMMHASPVVHDLNMEAIAPADVFGAAEGDPALPRGSRMAGLADDSLGEQEQPLAGAEVGEPKKGADNANLQHGLDQSEHRREQAQGTPVSMVHEARETRVTLGQQGGSRTERGLKVSIPERGDGVSCEGGGPRSQSPDRDGTQGAQPPQLERGESSLAGGPAGVQQGAVPKPEGRDLGRPATEGRGAPAKSPGPGLMSMTTRRGSQQGRVARGFDLNVPPASPGPAEADVAKVIATPSPIPAVHEGLGMSLRSRRGVEPLDGPSQRSVQVGPRHGS